MTKETMKEMEESELWKWLERWREEQGKEVPPVE
jgi:hypothetical protein